MCFGVRRAVSSSPDSVIYLGKLLNFLVPHGGQRMRLFMSIVLHNSWWILSACGPRIVVMMAEQKWNNNNIGHNFKILDALKNNTNIFFQSLVVKSCLAWHETIYNLHLVCEYSYLSCRNSMGFNSGLLHILLKLFKIKYVIWNSAIL